VTLLKDGWPSRKLNRIIGDPDFKELPLERMPVMYLSPVNIESNFWWQDWGV
jgi:hypothetical protein